MCFVLISFLFLLFFHGGKKKENKKRSIFPSASNIVSPHYEITTVCCQKSNISVCCLPCKISSSSIFFLKQTWWHCCNNKAYSPAKHLAKGSLHAPHHWAALDEGQMRNLTAPALQDTKRRVVFAGAPRVPSGETPLATTLPVPAPGWQTTPARQKAKAAWSCSLSAEPFNKVLKVSAGKLHQAKLLTGMYCPPWQQVGLHSKNVSKQPTALAASAKGVYSQIARQLLLLCSHFRSSWLWGQKKHPIY